MAKKKKGKKGGKKGKKGKVVIKRPSDKMEKAEGRMAMAEQSSKVWAVKVKLADDAKEEFRLHAKKWMEQNSYLQRQMELTERDTIDVISFLKKQDENKDKTVEELQREIQELKRESRQEKEELIKVYTEKIEQVEASLYEKEKKIEEMQTELRLVKEFRRKRQQMQKELDEIKEAIFYERKKNEEDMRRIEKKFLEEKVKLQHESNQKIAELAERAHSEAILNLDTTTKTVFKENMKLSQSLHIHVKEQEKLKAERDRLVQQMEMCRAENEDNKLMLQEKVLQTNHMKQYIRQLEDKVKTLETSLSHFVREFETERKDIQLRTDHQTKAKSIEVDKLRHAIDMKTKEMQKVKRLARNILEERADVERFFLDALDYVRLEITAHQSQYKRDAQLAYQQKMFAANVGKGEFPKVRTFNKGMDNSTNSVFQDFGAADNVLDEGRKVDIGDLTWEQKERVLRILFAKMNGVGATKLQARLQKGSGDEASPAALPGVPLLPPLLPPLGMTMSSLQLTSAQQSDDLGLTFLTQQLTSTQTLPADSFLPSELTSALSPDSGRQLPPIVAN